MATDGEGVSRNRGVTPQRGSGGGGRRRRPSGELLFTTDPNISAQHLVVLADDRAVPPAENITPVVGRDVAARYGTRLLTLINAVSARLTTGSVRFLDAQVVLDGRRAGSVAGAWLRAHGLMQAGGGGR